jgi:hypothetical protein
MVVENSLKDEIDKSLSYLINALGGKLNENDCNNAN